MDVGGSVYEAMREQRVFGNGQVGSTAPTHAWVDQSRSVLSERLDAMEAPPLA